MTPARFLPPRIIGNCHLALCPAGHSPDRNSAVFSDHCAFGYAPDETIGSLRAMWGKKRAIDEELPAGEPAAQPSGRLKDALRKARVEQAERTGVVVDLHDAEVARLEALNDELDAVFEELPADVDMFDRGISRGETPRLWIDAIAHVAMGRDKRVYRFLQDSRYGRKVLAETVHVGEMVDAITKYIAQRLIERERALADNSVPVIRDLKREAAFERRRRRRRAIRAFLFGLLAGFATLIAAAILFPGSNP